jgi:hypothetical protein
LNDIAPTKLIPIRIAPKMNKTILLENENIILPKVIKLSIIVNVRFLALFTKNPNNKPEKIPLIARIVNKLVTVAG